jgi:hypothetical protein
LHLDTRDEERLPFANVLNIREMEVPGQLPQTSCTAVADTHILRYRTSRPVLVDTRFIRDWLLRASSGFSGLCARGASGAGIVVGRNVGAGYGVVR